MKYSLYIPVLLVICSCSIVFSCCLSTEGTPPKDYSDYFPVHVGDTLLFVAPLGYNSPDDTLKSWVCDDRGNYKGFQYYQYILMSVEHQEYKKVDTLYLRKNNLGDVYQYYKSIDSDALYIDFHRFSPKQDSIISYYNPGRIIDTDLTVGTLLGIINNCLEIEWRTGIDASSGMTIAPGIGPVIITSYSSGRKQYLKKQLLTMSIILNNGSLITNLKNSDISTWRQVLGV